MSKTSNILFLLFVNILLFPSSISAQNQVSELDWKTHLENLKEGILLVRLRNVDNKVQKLKSLGAHDKAKETKQKNNSIRKELSESFSEVWEFSDVLFFNSENTKEILQGNFAGNVFDTIQNTSNTFRISGREIYLLDFGKATPAGEFSTYNGEGVWIRHLHDGQLKTIRSDLFYQVAPFKISSNTRKIYPAVIELNSTFTHKLQKLMFKKKRKELKNKIKKMKTDG